MKNKGKRVEKRVIVNMGKLLMLVLLFIPLFLDALSLKMTYNVEMGYLPKGVFKTYENEYLKDQLCFNQVFYTRLESYFHLKSFYIGGEIETVVKKLKYGYTFFPEKSTYKMALGFDFDGVELGFRHYCIHPTIPYIHPDLQPAWKGSYEEIFIRFSGKTGR